MFRRLHAREYTSGAIEEIMPTGGALDRACVAALATSVNVLL